MLIGAAAALLPAVLPAFGAGQAYEDPQDIYAALNAGPVVRLTFGRGAINLVFADGAQGVDRARVMAWVRRAAQSMATYFGHFPIEEYGLLVIAEPGDRVGHATTFGYRGPVTRIRVGTDATDAAFARDWVLVHEMIHAALPNLPRRALWVQEGSATYLEPIARAQAGNIPVADVWSQLLAGTPKGLAGAAPGGFDGTQLWGQLYWGGALFWLMAEIAVFEQSRGRHLLRDAVRAMASQSGGNNAMWAPEQMMQVGDQAVGVTVLGPLYKRFAEQGAAGVDLPALFERLGVAASASGGVMVDDRAPLAHLRVRMTRA